MNFLHDKTQTPHMRMTRHRRGLRHQREQRGSEVAAIRKLLKIHQFDPDWTLPSRLDDNPLVWMLRSTGS